MEHIAARLLKNKLGLLFPLPLRDRGRKCGIKEPDGGQGGQVYTLHKPCFRGNMKNQRRRFCCVLQEIKKAQAYYLKEIEDVEGKC
jgi:hypothetical protein